MRIALPASIQRGGARGLVAVPPRVVAPKSDAHRQTVTLNDWAHPMPGGWALCEGWVGDTQVAFCLSRDEKQLVILAGTSTGIVQILGHPRAVVDQIKRTKFGVGVAESDGVVGDARAAAARGEL